MSGGGRLVGVAHGRTAVVERHRVARSEVRRPMLARLGIIMLAVLVARDEFG
jgi:hypothetical protein